MSKKSADIKRAIPTLSREAVISSLSRAGTGELVHVILDALQQNPAKKPQNDGDCEVGVVLAQVFRSRDESANRLCRRCTSLVLPTTRGGRAAICRCVEAERVEIVGRKSCRT